MKLKKILKKSGKIFQDVMVVVVGIAITFSLNNWMSIKKERKDMQQYLNAVKMELEDNLNTVEGNTRIHKATMKFCEYLNSHKPETYQTDSIVKYNWIINGNYIFLYKTSAFEMLKMSGTMRLMKDKELLSNIWNTYQCLETLKGLHDIYMQRKEEEMYNFWTIIDDMNIQSERDIANALRLPEAKQYLSFLKIQMTRSNYLNFLRGAEQIRETIEAIDNQKIF